ncbi:MAG: nitrite reductase small subunit NirD [Rhodospirillaceae bacterium]|nr:nitrite reductase small subunit NirD [Rhodospirillales bacterium]
MDWTAIGTLNDIPPLGARTVETPLGQVAVFRTAEDEVFALINKCPHKGGPLSEGIVSGRKVACPLHNWVIDLNSGEAVAPDNGCTTVVPVKIEDGLLYLAPPLPPVAMATGPSLPREGGGV